VRAVKTLRRAMPLLGPARRDYRQALESLASQQRLSEIQHLRLAAGWFATAQQEDGGFSRGFSLLTGRWERSYPETTGYVIPSLYICAEILRDSSLTRTATRAADWLIHAQHSEGYFTDIDLGAPQVFDTAQCLEGLCAAALATGAPKYRRASERAIAWLIRLQSADGSWTSHTYNRTARAYYARVAAALLSAGYVFGLPEALRAGVAGLRWAAARSMANGFFSACHFDGKPALLHTLAYTSAALLRGYFLTRDQQFLGATLRNARGLLQACTATGDLPVESYNSEWTPLTTTRCCAGMGQYAAIFLFLHSIVADADEMRGAGMRLLDFLMRHQIKTGSRLTGSLPASLPVCDGYVGPHVVNWPAKFFIDGLILAIKPLPRRQWLV
jgi:hypothetical protein